MLLSKQSDLKLMALVKENPVLYDKNQLNYRNVDAKALVWQKISDELERSVKDCKIRWLHIRDTYRRLLKLRKKTGRRKPYKYENSISFMRPFFEDRSLLKDEPGDDANFECDYAEESQSSDEPKKKRTARKRKREFVDVQEFDTISTFNSSSELDKKDTIDAFLCSIGATLRTFSPYHLNVAKTKIFNIVQEHDLQQIVQQQEEEKTTR